MPIVATSPSARTHSCSLEYLRSSGTVFTLLSPCCTSGSLRSPPAVSSLRSSTVERCLHYRSGNVLAANADPEWRTDLREGRRYVGEGDVLFHRRPVRAARDSADDRPILRHLVAVARDTALDDQTGDLPLRSLGLFCRDDVAAGELLVKLAG